MKNLKEYSVIIGIILIHQLWVIFIQNFLYPIHFAPHNFFIFGLIGKEATISPLELSLLNVGNIVIIWLISRRIFTNMFSLVPSLIYVISPWSSYLLIAGSFYIYLSFLILLFSYGLLLIKSDQKYWGTILVLVTATIASYSSVLLSILLPFVIILIIIFGVISFNRLKKIGILLIILILPLLFSIFNNRLNFNNIFNSEITIFSDPGLLNTVNSYQGAARQDNLGGLAKISENKYIFFTEFVLIKYIKQLVPSTYFTSQEKLLNFSFSPPIYLGFLIPFVFGLYIIFNKTTLRKVIFLSSLLVIPSVLAKQAVDLNRLLIFAPVIIFIISYGLSALYKRRKDKVAGVFLIITLFLVAFQLLVVLSDIQIREKNRYIKYFGENYGINKQ